MARYFLLRARSTHGTLFPAARTVWLRVDVVRLFRGASFQLTGVILREHLPQYRISMMGKRRSHALVPCTANKRRKSSRPREKVSGKAACVYGEGGGEGIQINESNSQSQRLMGRDSSRPQNKNLPRSTSIRKK